MEKKKNSKHYIIPPSYFKKKGITPIPVTIPNQENKAVAPTEIKTVSEEKSIVSESKTVSLTETIQVQELPEITLKKEIKRTSGLSLSSIKAKKEHLIKQMDVIVDEEDLPKEPFTEEALVATWNAYVKELQDNGKHNLASILAIDTPKLKETTIHLEFPNETNKVEVERQQYDLLGFIRKALNNFDINLSITINDVMEKQYAYTPFEKFEKLKEKNKNIDILRKTFDLDI